MEVNGQLHAPSTLTPGAEQLLSGRGGEEKNSKPLPILEPADRPDRNPALYRQSYHGSLTILSKICY